MTSYKRKALAGSAFTCYLPLFFTSISHPSQLELAEHLKVCHHSCNAHIPLSATAISIQGGRLANGHRMCPTRAGASSLLLHVLANEESPPNCLLKYSLRKGVSTLPQDTWKPSKITQSKNKIFIKYQLFFPLKLDLPKA